MNARGDLRNQRLRHTEPLDAVESNNPTFLLRAENLAALLKIKDRQGHTSLP